MSSRREKRQALFVSATASPSTAVATAQAERKMRWCFANGATSAR